ncbi:MAG: hypothetical protein KAX49_02765 [Halanaerobiales bacterium]|nr:hypothetical protein [Halanaerobiales bacterium]
MTSIKILLNFPTSYSNVEYPSKNVMYYNKNKYSKKLFTSLLESSDYRCMYCGIDLSGGTRHDIVGTFEKEHSIEKKQDKQEFKFLRECKFNFSVSCPDCNKYKSEKLTFLNKEFLNIDYDECRKKECSYKCIEFEEALDKYVDINNIIIQPGGTYETRTGFPLKIQYDVLEKRFTPSTEYGYDDDVKRSIELHIKRFKLNKRNLNILDQIITDLHNDVENESFRKLAKKSAINPVNNNYKNVLDDIFIDYFHSLSKKQKRMTVKRIFAAYTSMNK